MLNYVLASQVQEFVNIFIKNYGLHQFNGKSSIYFPSVHMHGLYNYESEKGRCKYANN